MVAVKAAIEKTYIGKCEVVEYQEIQNSDYSTGHEEVLVQSNLPCKLSFESNNPVSQSDGVGEVTQTTKVFMSPDVNVKTGSKLIVTQNGITTSYQCSGKPTTYVSHQEITLILFEEWS